LAKKEQAELFMGGANLSGKNATFSRSDREGSREKIRRGGRSFFEREAVLAAARTVGRRLEERVLFIEEEKETLFFFPVNGFAAKGEYPGGGDKGGKY